MASRRAPRYRTGDPDLDARILDLLEAAGTLDQADLVFEILVSGVRLGREGVDRGDLKLVNSALKELRYAFGVFAPYRETRKVSIFGSARTEVDDPAYVAARDFGRAMAAEDWMVITGAGPGIMEAGIEGAGADAAFGVNIVLPFEQEPAGLLADDPKLVNYRYFFTRKIAFMKESSAFALLPGGFGTLDETFELLTLMQTGRSALCPVVLIEPEGSTYWRSWMRFTETELAGRSLISPDDMAFVRVCATTDEAVREICHFYRRYHSMRVVGRRLVIRLQRAPDTHELAELNAEFAAIVAGEPIEVVAASAGEVEDGDVVDLPRIAFTFDRRSFAGLRRLIDRLNENDRDQVP
ncbi:MAG: LOG family protein [Acidimicrobiales bacterium]|nr:LOG family protein [Acidimicrobiales bacterium]